MKTRKRSLPLVIIVFFVLIAFGAGFGLSQALSPGIGQGLPEEFNTLGEVWHYLSQDYVNKQALDPAELAQGAIRGSSRPWMTRIRPT